MLRNGEVLHYLDMPLIPNGGGMVKNRVDPQRLAATLLLWHCHGAVCVIEDVQPFGNNGAVGMFSLGQSLGIAIGAAATAGYQVVLVKPAKWKNDLGLSRDKGASLEMARAKFAGLPLNLKKHEGRAEAALLAHWYKYEVAFGGD